MIRIESEGATVIAEDFSPGRRMAVSVNDGEDLAIVKFNIPSATKLYLHLRAELIKIGAIDECG